MGQINHCLIAYYILEIAPAMTGSKRPQFKITCVQTINIVYHFYIYANDYKTVNSQKTLRNQVTSCLQKESPDRNFLHFHLITLLHNEAIVWDRLPRATESFAINYGIISWRTQTRCILRRNNAFLGSMFCFPVRISNPHDWPSVLYRFSRVFFHSLHWDDAHDWEHSCPLVRHLPVQPLLSLDSML